MNIEKLRLQIDDIDQGIIEKLNERVILASEIGKIKVDSGENIFVPSREEEVFQRLVSLSKGPLDEKAIRAIYRQIISASINLQKKLNIAYLGPEATYTHQAALQKFGSSIQSTPAGTIPDVFSSVLRGDADYGVIPVENSTEGVVSHSLDMLAETELKIVSQVYLKISHCLISQSDLNNITEVHSKDNALGQCRNWLSKNLPNAEVVECASTSKAVLFAKENPEIAAIAGSIAAELNDVPIVAKNIQDKVENITRFLVIGKSSSGALGNGKDKSSFVFSLKDEVGALLKALKTFSDRGINLCKIESRPSRQKLWDYYFFVDVIGHIDDQSIQDAIKDLEKNCPYIKWLGSYPDLY